MVSATTARNMLMSLLTVTTTLYLAPVGKKDPKDTALRRSSIRQGYWGPPTADFDWCEENYPYSEGLMQYVAEPWNTFSNLVWQPVALVVGLRLGQLGMLDLQAVLGLVLIALIGTGSFLFHATLLYEAQLVDELPMVNFIVLGAWLSYSRQSRPGAAGSAAAGAIPGWACAAYGLAFVPWLTLTSHGSMLHGAGRVVMSVSFTICFISVGVSTCRLVEELREVMPAGDGDELERIHTGAFAACICGIVGWITDSLQCDFWQNLPWGLPYPQLHANLWHNLMLVTATFVVLLQAQYRQVFLVCGGSKASLGKSPQRGRVLQSMLPPRFS